MPGSRPATRTGARLRRAMPGAWGVVSAAVAILALALIRDTLMPGVWFWDTAEAQTVPPLLGTMHPTGFPAYAILGWVASAVLTPFGDPAVRMNLLSALLVAAAGGASVLVLRELGVPGPVAAATGLAIALTPIAWEIGTAADAHALHLALVVALTLALVGWERRARDARRRADGAHPAGRTPGARADRWLVAAAAVFGVMLANHSLTLLLIPAIGLYVLAVEPRILQRPGFVVRCVGTAAVVAGLLYLQLPLRAGPFPAPIVYGNPATLEGFFYVTLAEQFRGSIVDPFGNLAGKALELVRLTAAQFGVLALVLPAAFAITAWRRPAYALFSGTAVLVTCFFAASYRNAEIDRYYLGPAFLAWTWVAILAAEVVALGAGTFRRVAASGSGPILPPRARGVLVAVVVGVVVLAPTLAALPQRREAVDQSGVTEGMRWLDDAFDRLAPDAVVVSWWSFSTTLWYGQLIEGRRQDVWIVDDRTRLDEDLGEVGDVIEANLGQRPVYVIRETATDIVALSRRYVLELVSPPWNLYRVVREHGVAP